MADPVASTSLLGGLTSFLLELLYFGIDWLYNAMIDCINAIILILATFIQGLVALFPNNPCNSLIASCSDSLSTLEAPPDEMWSLAIQTVCWLLPMEYIAHLIGCAMTTVMAYFLIAPLMRWAKLST